ncbi:STAS domain-containing protein [Thiolapillus sp.]
MATSEQLITLQQNMELETLPELAGQINTALASAEALVLDGSAVRSIDAASLQLLLATILAAREKSIHCHWREAAAPLRNAAARLGLTDELSLTEKEQ